MLRELLKESYVERTKVGNPYQDALEEFEKTITQFTDIGDRVRVEFNGSGLVVNHVFDRHRLESTLKIGRNRDEVFIRDLELCRHKEIIKGLIHCEKVIVEKFIEANQKPLKCIDDISQSVCVA